MADTNLGISGENPEEQNTGEAPNAGEENKGDKPDEAGKGGEGQEQKPKEKKEEKEEQEETGQKLPQQIEKRKSAQYFVGERHGKKAAKAESREIGDEEIIEDEEVTPAGQKAIKDAISPMTNAFKASLDDQEVKDHLAVNPEHKEFESVVRMYMKDPDYAAVPVSLLFNNFAYRKAESIGAEKNERANAENKMNQMGGDKVIKKTGQEGQLPDIWKMSEKDFEELVQSTKLKERAQA